jgi:hypothetical protein
MPTKEPKGGKGGEEVYFDTILNEKDHADHATNELTNHESSSTIYHEVLNSKQLMSMLANSWCWKLL